MSFDDITLQKIAAEFGTPCYVYSEQMITQNFQAFYDVLAKSSRQFKINYAVKANSNLTILNLLSQLGAGFDVVSGGELERVLAAGGKANDIVFAGVGKTIAEINSAIDLDICSIHIESEAELRRINELAVKKNKQVKIGLRINPDVTGDSHPYNTTGSKDNKFGIAHDQAIDMYLLAKSLPNIHIKGITCHIGSQITTLEPFVDAIKQLLVIIDQLKQHDIQLQYIDIGGGLGICYKDETPPTPQAYVTAVLDALKNCNLALHLEPGRAIVANAGILLTTVEYLKQAADNNFAIVDAGMNDLIRPALYESYHNIVPVQANTKESQRSYSVVGPICESGDFFAINPKRELQIASGDLLAIQDCGAYGFSMSSNYNTRPRCAEVMVDGNKIQLIRKRETIEQLLANEKL